MDESRRNFILGMSSAYAVLSISAATGSSMILKGTNNILEKKNINASDWKFSSYDTFSPALIASVMSSIMLNNIDYLYSLIIVFITLFLLFTIGVPGYEYLMTYSELYFISA
jgi:hypothetical protein